MFLVLIKSFTLLRQPVDLEGEGAGLEEEGSGGNFFLVCKSPFLPLSLFLGNPRCSDFNHSGFPSLTVEWTRRPCFAPPEELTGLTACYNYPSPSPLPPFLPTRVGSGVEPRPDSVVGDTSHVMDIQWTYNVLAGIH